MQFTFHCEPIREVHNGHKMVKNCPVKKERGGEKSVEQFNVFRKQHIYMELFS